MNEFTSDEIEGIIKAMSHQHSPAKEKNEKIPLRPPGTYGTISKVTFTPIEGETLAPLSEITEKDLSHFNHLKAQVEVIYGKTKLSLKELASLEEGSLIPLDNLCDDLVDIYINGTKIGRGEIVAVDGQFGVKIVSFSQKP